MYLVHWPLRLIPKDGDRTITLPLRADGKTRDVDVNWKIGDTWKSMEALTVQPAGKSHPLLDHSSILIFAQIRQRSPKLPVSGIEVDVMNFAIVDG